jgi:TolB protein
MWRRVIVIVGMVFVCALMLSSAALAMASGNPRMQIAYVVYRQGNADIVLMDVERHIQRDWVNHEDSFEGMIAWSPDGERLAFISDREDGMQIYTVNFDGSNLRRISYQDGITFGSVRWTRDSTRLLALARTGGNGLMYSMTPEGDQFQPYTVPEVEAGGITMNADVAQNEVDFRSPDGAMGIYVRYQQGEMGIYVTRTTRREGQFVAHVGTQYTEPPSWSHDSRAIVFVSNHGGRPELYLAQLQPTIQAPIQLTDSREYELNPIWRP